MTEPHRIGGRYEVGELLGRGGMAEVRKGTDVRLGRTVAIKRLRTDLASDATFQARFRREAQSAASLNHPAIVSVYDTGEEMSTDGSNVAQPYIVMEYVAGRTLRDILREGRKILPERALEITSGVLAALDYSHRAGHHPPRHQARQRDAHPGRRREGDGLRHRPGGLRRLQHDDPDRRGRRHRAVPLPRAGPRRDRRLPLRRLLHRLPALRAAHRTAAVRRATARSRWPTSTSASRRRRRRAYDEELTPEIDAIVMKSLAKNVGDRYPSAAAMKADIDRYLAGQAGAGSGGRRRAGDRLRPAGRPDAGRPRSPDADDERARAQAPRSAHPAAPPARGPDRRRPWSSGPSCSRRAPSSSRCPPSPG